MLQQQKDAWPQYCMVTGVHYLHSGNGGSGCGSHCFNGAGINAEKKFYTDVTFTAWPAVL